MQGQHILLYAAGSLALREVRRVLRRITNEDSDEERRERKRLVGIAAKAVHANPLAALDPGVTQASPSSLYSKLIDVSACRQADLSALHVPLQEGPACCIPFQDTAKLQK